jgi:hypothetical protein
MKLAKPGFDFALTTDSIEAVAELLRDRIELSLGGFIAAEPGHAQHRCDLYGVGLRPAHGGVSHHRKDVLERPISTLRIAPEVPSGLWCDPTIHSISFDALMV